MDRSTTEDGPEPLDRSRTLPLLVVVLATVGITATGLFARGKART